ncbi:MAG: hypothetical protein R6V06_03730, partial [Kiritimatiellia bacterium]
LDELDGSDLQDSTISPGGLKSERQILKGRLEKLESQLKSVEKAIQEHPKQVAELQQKVDALPDPFAV